MRMIDADAFEQEIRRHIIKNDCGRFTAGQKAINDSILDCIDLLKKAPTVAEEITGFATSRVTNDVVGRFGEKILDNVKQEVIQSIGARLYQEGAITIEKVEDRARQEMVLIGRVSVLKKEGYKRGEHQG